MHRPPHNTQRRLLHRPLRHERKEPGLKAQPEFYELALHKEPATAPSLDPAIDTINGRRISAKDIEKRQSLKANAMAAGEQLRTRLSEESQKPPKDRKAVSARDAPFEFDFVRNRVFLFFTDGKKAPYVVGEFEMKPDGMAPALGPNARNIFYYWLNLGSDSLYELSELSTAEKEKIRSECLKNRGSG